jgi:hypothetical protein
MRIKIRQFYQIIFIAFCAISLGVYYFSNHNSIISFNRNVSYSGIIEFMFIFCYVTVLPSIIYEAVRLLIRKFDLNPIFLTIIYWIYLLLFLYSITSVKRIYWVLD